MEEKQPTGTHQRRKVANIKSLAFLTGCNRLFKQ